METLQQIVGLRVVRGPDWVWSNQDEGEGHVGTIVEVGSPGQMSPERTVVVFWDHGLKTNYRVGYHHAFDLRIFDNGPVGVEHCGSLCCACETRDIKGFKWRCTRCLVDLCSRCYFMDCHDVKHQFFRFDHPQSSGIPCPQRLGSARATAKGIFAGAKVVRGPDWDWNEQDGGDGQQGKVQEIRGWEDETYRSVANVTWPNGLSNVYRIGHKGKVDLKYVKSSKGGNYYPDHLPVVDLSNMPVPPQQLNMANNISPVAFVLGERVKVSLDLELLKVMQEGHGGWNPKMNDVIDRIGCVHRITEKGDVRVIYDNGVKWTFHQAALTKVPLFQVGDCVVVTKNVAHLLEQVESRDEAAHIAGSSGYVSAVKPDGTFDVNIRNKNYTLHVNCLQPSIVGRVSASSYMGGVSNGAFGDRVNEIAMPPEMEQLMTALESADLTQVTALISKDSMFSVVVFPNGRQPLHIAAQLDSPDILKFLISCDEIEVNAMDLEHNTPLHLAALNPNPEIMKHILKANGVDVNKRNTQGKTPLILATLCDKMVKIDMLLNERCDVNMADNNGETAIFHCIVQNKTEMALRLLNLPEVDFKIKTLKDVTYLHQACAKGNLEVSAVILDLCPDLVNVIDKNSKFSPLHMAVLHDHDNIVQLLLANGADANLVSNKKFNALMLAVCCASLATVSRLVSVGTSLEQVDSDHNNCLAYLFQNLAKVNKLTSYNESTLTADFAEIRSLLTPDYSEVSRDALLACYLISKGVKYKASKNKSGLSAIEMCADPDLVNIIENFVKQNNDGASSSVKCSLCNKHPANCQFKPCEHVISCENCAGCLKKCLMCRQDVESYSKLSITIQKICQVCDDMEANIRFEPCGHNVVCNHCAVRMKKCFSCQTPINAKIDLMGNDVTSILPSTSTGGPQSSSEELSELKSKLEQLEDAALCQICIERPKNVVFMCGHTFCDTCASSMHLCPNCRQKISRVIPIYSG